MSNAALAWRTLATSTSAFPIFTGTIYSVMTAIPGNIESFKDGSGITDITYQGIAATAQAQGLLDALTSFIQPVIFAYLPHAAQAVKPDQNAQPAGSSTNEGQKLLTALEEYITVIAGSQSLSERSGKAKDNPSPQEIPAIDSVSVIATQPVRTSDDVKFSNLLDAMRKHVFSNMPIRLLAFDSNGSGLQLIERNEILRRALQTARGDLKSPEFETAWDAGETVRWKNKRHKMISDLVEQHTGYAILSHTWIREVPGDVIFGDWLTRQNNARGYWKLSKFCETVATSHGLAFAWMDTVCINKESSSELDESIRSMYKWYRGAHICIAYLSETRTLQDMAGDSWFTRGWTLQEFLAPREIQFYNGNWNTFPQADATELQAIISSVTGITMGESELCRLGKVDEMPISRRFQLAAQRQVTREEDAAYSLMGLLGVDISIAYGEGFQRAFFRLLREILSTKRNVLDIFNHNYFSTRKIFQRLLPDNIQQYMFRSSQFDGMPDRWKPIEPIILTHLGVRIPLLLVPGLKARYEWTDASNLGSLRDLLSLPIKGWLPRGDFSGHIDMSITPEPQASRSPETSLLLRYNLLDNGLFNRNDESNNDFTPFAPAEITFGVVNFTMDGDDIQLPHLCLSVPLNAGNSRDVRPTDNIRVMEWADTPVFRLQSASNKSTIQRNDLGRHGIQLINLYL